MTQQPVSDDDIRGLLEVMTLMVRADGTTDHDEILHFMETIAEQAPFDSIANDHLFRLAQQVGNQSFETEPHANLQRLATMLSPDLRVRAYELAHALSLADGHRDDRETSLLQALQDVFGLSDDQVSFAKEA